MSKETVQSFIKMVVEENLVQAQSTIKGYLNEKLTEILEEKYEQYAPTIFESAKPDFLDLDGDGNTKEPMKTAAAQAEQGDDDEDVEEDEEQSEEEEEDETEDEDEDEDEED